MRGLHRVLHDRDQMLSQLIQVDLIAQRGTECLYDLGRVIFAAVEASINDGLDTMTEWLEQRRNRQRRNHNGDAVILADDSPQQVLESKDETKVEQC